MQPWNQQPYQAHQPGGWPQQPYQPPYGALPPQQPSAVTAIIAAVLSFLGAAANIIGPLFAILGVGVLAAVASDSDFEFPGWYYPITIISSIVQLVAGIGLVVGGIMLLRKTNTGRMIIAISCAGVIVVSILGIISGAALTSWAEDRLDGADLTGSVATNVGVSVVGLIFPIATLVLALLPATRQYCEGANRNSPFGAGYPQAPPQQYPPAPPQQYPFYG